ncbi:hypothetical protein J2R76_002500 [Bradyrhizobium sp. USDA 4532]|uniref:hypothetical protein n=1 Tax=unclassified Bradyrhizobium TaxID=2631580 RepID=UPI00209F85E9|nr:MULTISPECIES: hypothetical protein [unclassified Bradyrhizobium]MCP1834163.1 hypothetical protein [Bradyrhizobium sp. USDA 4545]MCP1918909.1 hypothetical protein [Bradyrhizobium sp. USDA 4532]
MLEEFDHNTIANMTAAMDYVCKKIPPGRDSSALRKRIADEIRRRARSNVRSLVDLQQAGLTALAVESAAPTLFERLSPFLGRRKRPHP